MNIQLTFQSQDYEFIVEAIKLRTTAILEAMSMQFDSQVLAANQRVAEQMGDWSIRKEGNGYVAEINEAAAPVQKPKKSPKKSKEAPFGYKKDGTPKKRPGRPVGI